MAAHEQEGELITGINVTPLVDVVLVLLAILMVTASFLAREAIGLDPPDGTPNTVAPPEALAVQLDARGALYLDGVPVQERELVRRARELVRRLGPDAHGSVTADAHTDHEAVVRALSLLTEARLVRLSIGVEPAHTAD